MNPQDQIPKPTGKPVEIDADSTESVDDFIRQLEEKERDLHITADLSIEIADDSEDDVDTLFAMLGQPSTNAAESGSVDEPATAPAAAAAEAPAVPKEKGKSRSLELENEIAALKLRVFELRNERNEVQEKSDRRLKDFENYRYRMDRERRGSFIDQIANLASQMLPVLDNLNRAIDMLPPGSQKSSPEFEQLFDGIVLVNQQMNEVLAGMGVTPITSVGETFDPHFHEAVAIEERGDLPANTIADELLRGYKIGNKVIRHSMVKVVASNSPAKDQPAAAETDDEQDLDGTLA